MPDEIPKDKPPKAVSVDPPTSDSKAPPKTPRARKKGESATDTPPKKPGTGKAGRKPELQSRIENGFLTIAFGVSVMDFQDGQIIAENAENLAAAWYRVALKNEVVRKFFEVMTKTSSWGEAVVVTGMVMVPIAQNHDLIPSGFQLLPFQPKQEPEE